MSLKLTSDLISDAVQCWIVLLFCLSVAPTMGGVKQDRNVWEKEMASLVKTETDRDRYLVGGYIYILHIYTIYHTTTLTSHLNIEQYCISTDK